MTIQEMHIEFDQGSQQVAANKTLKLLPPEKDWILNRAQDRFIKSKLKAKLDERGRPTGGFEIQQLDADALRTIIVSSYDLVPYIDQDGRRYKCFLPPDYSYLLSDWSYTKKLCNGESPTVLTGALYVTAIRQEKSPLSIPPFYNEVEVFLHGKTVSIPNDLPYWNQFNGYDAVEDISFLRPYISLQGKWYWERFDNLYFPSYYIAVSNDSQTLLNPYVKVDGAVYNDKIKLSNYFTKQHLANGQYYDNRLSATDNISGMNSTEFIKSSFYSPISELSNGILYVYFDKSFIVSSVGISYVRKPQPMSLYLGCDCELPEEFHREVCALAIENFKGDLADYPGYQQKVADNNLRVNL